MDIAAVAVILIVLLVFGAVGAVAARGTGWRPATALPEWASGRRLRERLTTRRPADAPVDGRTVVTRPTEQDAPPVPVVPPPTEPDLSPELRQLRDAILDGWRDEWRREMRAAAAPAAVSAERLARLERRVDEQVDRLVRRLDDLDRTTATERAAAEALQAAAFERLRADLIASLAARDAAAAERAAQLPRPERTDRRAEVTAELYGRLARLEAAVAAVTNPILLPGEPYAPPTEFLGEALVWENWKDVGERAFAFADYFNAQRLQLAEPVCAEVAAFVTALRGLLTRSIYPNLRQDAAPAQLQALRAALDRLAAELPRLRGRLEAEFRAQAGEGADRGDDGRS